MPDPPKLGQYRHQPATGMITGPDGKPRPARVRRRFPFLGLVPLAYGALTPLLCAGFAWLLRLLNTVPRQLGPTGGGPAPSFKNVIFGFGYLELLVAWALTGFLLWRMLWNQRVPADLQRQGLSGVMPGLVRTGAVVGPALAMLSVPLAVAGMAIGTPEMREVPMLARPFFALLGSPVIAISALVNPAILFTTLALGLVVGSLSGVMVAILWQQFPEEPVHKP